MAIEQKWPAVAPRQLTSNGTTLGQINIADARGFKVKQRIVIGSSTQPSLQLQVKRVYPTQLIVGPLVDTQGKQGLTARQDISMYTVADGAYVFAEEQDKSKLKPDDIEQAVYEQEPTVAKRVVMVDQYGRTIDSKVDENGNIRILVETPNGMVPSEYDEFDLAYDADGNLIEAKFYLNNVLLTTMDLQYDADGNLIHGER